MLCTSLLVFLMVWCGEQVRVRKTKVLLSPGCLGAADRPARWEQRLQGQSQRARGSTRLQLTHLQTPYAQELARPLRSHGSTVSTLNTQEEHMRQNIQQSAFSEYTTGDLASG